jgi:hypothetical protein
LAIGQLPSKKLRKKYGTAINCANKGLSIPAGGDGHGLVWLLVLQKIDVI